MYQRLTAGNKFIQQYPSAEHAVEMPLPGSLNLKKPEGLPGGRKVCGGFGGKRVDTDMIQACTYECCIIILPKEQVLFLKGGAVLNEGLTGEPGAGAV